MKNFSKVFVVAVLFAGIINAANEAPIKPASVTAKVSEKAVSFFGKCKDACSTGFDHVLSAAKFPLSRENYTLKNLGKATAVTAALAAVVVAYKVFVAKEAKTSKN